jgi:hypothetical protein
VPTAKSELIHKIPDENLRRFAIEGDEDEEFPILVELALEPVDSKWLKPWSFGHAESRSGKVAPPPSPLETRRAQMDGLAELLSASGIKEASKIGIADAFVVQANPKQLRSIVESPLVGTVRPNRTHGKRAAR